METVKTELIALTSYPAGESGGYVVFFSAECGKLKARMGFSRKKTPSGGSPPGTGDLILAEFVLKTESDWIALKRWEMVRPFQPVPKYENLILQQIIPEFYEKHPFGADVSREAFDLLKRFFGEESASESPGTKNLKVPFVLYRLIGMVGHAFRFDICLRCGVATHLPSGETPPGRWRLNRLGYRFDVSAHGLVCSNCDEETSFDSRFVKLCLWLEGEAFIDETNLGRSYLFQGVKLLAGYLGEKTGIRLRTLTALEKYLARQPVRLHKTK